MRAQNPTWSEENNTSKNIHVISYEWKNSRRQATFATRTQNLTWVEESIPFKNIQGDTTNRICTRYIVRAKGMADDRPLSPDAECRTLSCMLDCLPPLYPSTHLWKTDSVARAKESAIISQLQAKQTELAKPLVSNYQTTILSWAPQTLLASLLLLGQLGF